MQISHVALIFLNLDTVVGGSPYFSISAATCGQRDRPAASMALSMDGKSSNSRSN